MNIEKLNELLKGSGVTVHSTFIHTKASEHFVDVQIVDSNRNISWDGRIPYHDRRKNLDLKTEEDVANYLISIMPFFETETIEKWIKEEIKIWDGRQRADVTSSFFKKLSTLDWIHGDDFPRNSNPQRRIQDIKDEGYTVSSRQIGRKWERQLVPIPKFTARKYEIFTPAFKLKALRVLDYIDVYELSSGNRRFLLPDHKFPEIRWDDETRAENPESMSDEEIKKKFQLLTNQRNLQKREVCRQCFQTGKRPSIFGLSRVHKITN